MRAKGCCTLAFGGEFHHFIISSVGVGVALGMISTYWVGCYTNCTLSEANKQMGADLKLGLKEIIE
jgi:hypothetical protein